MFAAAVLEEENNKTYFHWEKSFIFMQIAFIVLLLQHGRREHTLFRQGFFRSPGSGGGGAGGGWGLIRPPPLNSENIEAKTTKLEAKNISFEVQNMSR